MKPSVKVNGISTGGLAAMAGNAQRTAKSVAKVWASLGIEGKFSRTDY
jgi:hypothetical protein